MGCRSNKSNNVKVSDVNIENDIIESKISRHLLTPEVGESVPPVGPPTAWVGVLDGWLVGLDDGALEGGELGALVGFCLETLRKGCV